MIKHEYRTVICETRQFNVAGSVAPCARRGSGLLRWVNCSYHHSPAIGYKVHPTGPTTARLPTKQHPNVLKICKNLFG